MSNVQHPYSQLRISIRQAAEQYRRNNDNSDSLFHPSGGFIYAYNIPKVEEALDKYEESLPIEFKQQDYSLTLKDQLISMASQISDEHSSMEIRDFARLVLAHLSKKEKIEAREGTLHFLDNRFGEDD